MNSDLNNDFYDRLNMPMILDNDFSCFITDKMVKDLIVHYLTKNSVTQDELAKHGIRESSIKKYGLEHLVAGGYKERSEK